MPVVASYIVKNDVLQVFINTQTEINWNILLRWNTVEVRE